MGEQTHGARTGVAGKAAAPTARGWGGATAPRAGAHGAGHDLARIAISAPTVDAPIQRVRWTWDAANQSWSGPPGAAARQPAHKGTVDGESYEDTRRRHLFASS